MNYLQNWIDQLNPMAHFHRGQPNPMVAALSNADARPASHANPALVGDGATGGRAKHVRGIFDAT